MCRPNLKTTKPNQIKSKRSSILKSQIKEEQRTQISNQRGAAYPKVGWLRRRTSRCRESRTCWESAMALQGRRKARRCAGHLGCHRSKERCSCRCHDGFTTKGSDLVRLPSWREEKSRVESNRIESYMWLCCANAISLGVILHAVEN